MHPTLRTIHLINNAKDQSITINAYDGATVKRYTVNLDELVESANDLATLFHDHFKEEE